MCLSFLGLPQLSSLVDDMRRMYDKVNYPEEAQIHRFMSNLNDKYRDKVVNRIPRTLTEAVASALWFEDRDRGTGQICSGSATACV